LSDPRWLRLEVVLAVHEQQIAEHGGAPGLRDRGMLESALARPQQKAAYGEPDLADLAAAYAFGIARNHPFVDGNKRVAFVALELFLRINGFELVADDRACLAVMLDLAAGELEEEALAAWVRARLERRSPQP
jgi:death-on-curing protein